MASTSTMETARGVFSIDIKIGRRRRSATLTFCSSTLLLRRLRQRLKLVMKPKCISFLIILLINFFSSVYHVESKVFTVGDEDQWNTGTNYHTWSEKYNFTVGDVLAFVYVKRQHNVYEVMESTYKSCDVSRGVLATYETGKDEVKLMEAKKHWFICNVDQHCLGGMRFGVDVKDSSAIPINPAPTGGHENSGAFRGRGRGWDCLFALLIFLSMMFF